MPKNLLLKDFLPYKIAFLSGRISKKLSNLYMVKYDLVSSEWKVMALLHEYPEICASDIVRYTAIDKVAVSRAVNGLITKNYALRRAAASDRRRSLLTLTEEGQEIFNHIEPIVLNYEEKLIACLSSDEQEALEKMLLKITNHVETI